MVTGAGKGIGFSICRSFAAEGALVGLNDIDASLASAAVKIINQELNSERVIALPFDVSLVEEQKKNIAWFSGQHQGLDVFVANAGITNYGSFLSYEPEHFDQLTSVNMRGTYFSVQAAAKEMIQRETAGTIILISSAVGLTAHRNLGAYGASKAAIIMMGKSFGLELGPYGINTNVIAAGATLTERTKEDDPNYEENWKSVTPNKKAGRPEDVAKSCLFLASDDARQINGQTLVVDGGWSIYGSLPANHPQIL